MPYTITGHVGGLERAIVLHPDGITGDGLVVQWLKETLPPEQFAHASDHYGAILETCARLLSGVVGVEAPTPAPPAPGPPGAPAAGAAPAAAETHSRYTAEELDALTVPDLREFAVAAGVAGSQRLSKAELVAALLRSQGG